VRGDQFRLFARNDNVVLRADEGGQCDPFDPGDVGAITSKTRWFTVENGVACGQHWTDYVTFRFDARVGGFVFDNEREESWKMNPSNDPDAEALIPEGPQRVRRPLSKQTIAFRDWRRDINR
jgi:hypothetical protein